MSATHEPGGAGQPASRGAAPTPATNRRPALARRAQPRSAAVPVLVVTTDTLPVFEVHEVLGEVLGVLARPRNPYADGVKALSGKSVDSEVSGAALTRWR